MWRLETQGKIENGKKEAANEEDEEDVLEEGKEPKPRKMIRRNVIGAPAQPFFFTASCLPIPFCLLAYLLVSE